MTKKELEQILKEYAEENNIREIRIYITDLYNEKTYIDYKNY